uniref:Uncharacterized protein n=1 Tax=Phasianus colchicus TaxID=9054 RepID=A0A669QW92_PHACC
GSSVDSGQLRVFGTRLHGFGAALWVLGNPVRKKKRNNETLGSKSMGAGAAGGCAEGRREADGFSCFVGTVLGEADNDTITRNLYLHTKILIALVFFILKFA